MTHRAESSAVESFRLLGEDLSSGSIERASWGLLHHRYLLPAPRRMREVSERYGIPRRTIADRLTRACRDLAQVMRTAEVEASQRLARASRSAVDPVVVHAGAEMHGTLGARRAERDRMRTEPTAPPTRFHPGEASRRSPSDLEAYRLGRIAEWSQPRYRLDTRFVALTLLVDMGEEARSGRWMPRDERFTDLRSLLADVDEPVVVLLGPPGSGKSTLLRRLELDLAGEALAAASCTDESPVTFLVSLNQYRASVPGGTLPDPHTWLVTHWATRYPKLPALDALLAKGAVVLLLDGLNEMPHERMDEYHQRIMVWKRFLHDRVAAVPGNRAVVACRSLDYSAPLSTPRLRVPQVQTEPMTDEQVRAFLGQYSLGAADTIWSRIEGTAVLETVRWPFFLRLLVEQAVDTGEVGGGLVALFTGFVRRALAVEIERDNPLLAAGRLLDLRDVRRVVGRREWKTPWELPEAGILVPALSRLAYRMQASAPSPEASQVRAGNDSVLRMLDDEHSQDIVRAGAAMGVLDEDPVAGEVMYRHQLVQEYFAARVLADAPNPELVRVEWRAAKVRPSVREVIESLDPADSLPPLPTTGWEETTILASAMAKDPVGFLRGVTATNPALAARAACQPELMPRLPEDALDALRWALVTRLRDPNADLRDRIACGFALGDLGDPRLQRCEGPHGAYLLPPTVAIPGGTYPIGDDTAIEWLGGTTTAHVPRHEVEIAAFRIGQFPVTNAEYAFFLAAGGYEEERWWDTAAGRAWRRGIGTAADLHHDVRVWAATFRSDPALIDAYHSQGMWDDGVRERWLRRLAMTDAELDAHLHELYPERRITEPRHWREARFNHPAQPVVGVCWFEARAYCAWLSAQTGEAYRLPTEAEWEAAARGREPWAYAYGDTFDALKANTLETRIKRPTPVGVFVEGDTPLGVSDMTGNSWDWTSSLFGKVNYEPDFCYPYRADDGRENAEAGLEVLRVLRGGTYSNDFDNARIVSRVVRVYRPAAAAAGVAETIEGRASVARWSWTRKSMTGIPRLRQVALTLARTAWA